MKEIFKIISFIVVSLFVAVFILKGFYFFVLGGLIVFIIFLLFLKNFKWVWFFLVLSLCAGQLAVFEFNGARVLPTDILIGAIFIFWLFKKLLHLPYFCDGTCNNRQAREKRIKIDFLGGLIIVFLLISFLSLLNSLRFFDISELKTGFFYLIRLFLYLSLYFVFFDAAKKKNILWIFNWFLASVFLIAIFGFLQLAFFPDLSVIKEGGWDPHKDRLFSTWLDPNLLSLIFILGIVAVIGLFSFKKSLEASLEISLEIKKWLLFFYFIVFLIALALTYSRSGYLTFLVTILFLGILKSRKLLITTVVLVVIIVLVFPFVVERIQGMKKLDETARMRFESWQNAFQVIQKKPTLGIGYNNLSLIQGVGGSQLHSKSGFDSSFLTIWATTGIFGFLTLVAIFISAFWRGFKLLKKEKSQFLGIILLGVLISFLVHSQFVNSLLYPHLAVIFWSFLGITSGFYKKRALVHFFVKRFF